MFLPSSLSTGEVNTKLNMKQKNKEFNHRLCKTFNYGRKTKIDRPSLSATELIVSYFKEASCVKFDSIDKYWASNMSYDACISPCSIVFGMLYIERLRVNNPEYLKNTASQELFVVSMMLASKFIYDEGVNDEVFNEEWARSSNFDVKDLNRMEFRFLKAIDWKLFVSTTEFWRSLERIEKRIARKRMRKLPTYCDLATLSSDFDIYSLLIDIFKVTVFATITYTTMIFVISASIFSYKSLSKNLSTDLSLTNNTVNPTNIYNCTRLTESLENEDIIGHLSEDTPVIDTSTAVLWPRNTDTPHTNFSLSEYHSKDPFIEFSTVPTVPTFTINKITPADYCFLRKLIKA